LLSSRTQTVFHEPFIHLSHYSPSATARFTTSGCCAGEKAQAPWTRSTEHNKAIDSVLVMLRNTILLCVDLFIFSIGHDELVAGVVGKIL